MAAVHIDEEALQSSLQRLRQATFEADVAAVMKRAVNSVRGVFGCNGAGTMFITESGHLSYVAASDEAGRQLEEAKATAGRICPRTCSPRCVRWPAFPSCSAAARSARSTSTATSPPNGIAPTSRR